VKYRYGDKVRFTNDSGWFCTGRMVGYFAAGEPKKPESVVKYYGIPKSSPRFKHWLRPPKTNVYIIETSINNYVCVPASLEKMLRLV
jgi:hypothetical protein